MAEETRRSAISQEIVESAFREVVERSQDLILVLDRSNRVCLANPRFRDYFSLSESSLIGRTLRECLGPKVMTGPLLENIQACQKGQPLSCEIEHDHSRLGQRTLLATVCPWDDKVSGIIRGALLFFRDISREKKQALRSQEEERRLKQAEKMISLGILVSGVAHEINNPNHFIMSHVYPLTQMWQSIAPILEKYYRENGDFEMGGGIYSENQDQPLKMLQAIQEGANRIKAIVNELRDYAQERPSESIGPVRMDRVITSAITLLSHTISLSTHHFRVHLPEDTPVVQGNYQRLEQVVINLIQNGCESLESMERAVEVRLYPEDSGNQLVLEVRDEGMGIPSEQIPNIADPFFTTKRNCGGTGLGLSISSSIIAEHKGLMEHQPNPGGGTVARIILPVWKPLEDEEGTPP